jgi:hypothetical protein
MRLLDGFSRVGTVRLTGRRGAPVSHFNKVHSNMRCALRLVTFLLTLVAFGPSTALASGVWSAPTAIDIGGSSYLSSVSCTSATYNGTSWTAPTNIDDGDGAPGLTSVSCSSATFCAAVDQKGYALTYNGTSWTAPTKIVNPVDPQVFHISSVSCPSATFCVTVANNGAAVTYNGTSWTAPTKIAGSNADFQYFPVSCASATFCVAGYGAALIYRRATAPKKHRPAHH